MKNVECSMLNVEWLRARKFHSTFNIQHSTFTILLLALLSLRCSEHPSDNREHVIFWGLGREGEVVSDMIPEFERRNPNIHIVVQQIPFIAAHEKMLTAYVGNATPDMAQIGNSWIPEMVAIHALDELTPLVRASKAIDQRDYFPGIWATNVVGGGLYGIPWYVDTRLLFYRRDIIPRPPKTWVEWRAAMDEVVRDKKAHYAILMPTNEYEPILAFALSDHATFLNADGTRGAFEAPPFAEAFGFYIECFKRGWAPKVSNLQVANLYQQFASADFVMTITGPWQIAEFKRRLPANMQDKWATAPLPARDASAPTGVGMAGGSSLIIYRTSQHKEAARKFIDFLSEPAQQIRFYELSGDLPARRTAWSAPALKNDPHFPAFREQLERVEPLPKVPEWEQIATAMYQHGEEAVRGAKTPPQALAALDRQADEILEKRRWLVAHHRQ
jgi:multiple sugar transport system substrate-binding protein